MSVADSNLLDKVAQRISQPGADAPSGVKASILTVAAGSYASRPVGEEVTVPTGFDPQAAALFEAVVEAAFLVANADGEFDDAERAAFERVVLQACGGLVADGQIHALLADLGDQLEEDGLDARIAMVGRSVSNRDHQREVLRIAGLLAHVSGDVSAVERSVLDKLATAFGLDEPAVDKALEEVRTALG
jgi:tellurite resistance protein